MSPKPTQFSAMTLAVLVLLCASITSAISENAATDPNSAALMGDDLISCLKDSNLTYEEASEMEFFNPNNSIPHNAKCFATCVIATDYNVSVSSEGIIEKEGLLLAAIMQDTEMDFVNATDVVDICKKIVTEKADVCENIYNYATCVNLKYFEKKGVSNFTGTILGQYSLQNGESTQESFNSTSTAASSTTS